MTSSNSLLVGLTGSGLLAAGADPISLVITSRLSHPTTDSRVRYIDNFRDIPMCQTDFRSFENQNLQFRLDFGKLEKQVMPLSGRSL